MNKSELIDAVASKANASKAASAVLLSATLEVIAEALSKGDSVQLIGFGTFSVGGRAARMGRNPQTGKALNPDCSLGRAMMARRFSSRFRHGRGVHGRDHGRRGRA